MLRTFLELGNRCLNYAVGQYCPNDSDKGEWKVIKSWYLLETVAIRAWDCGRDPYFRGRRLYRHWDSRIEENDAIQAGIGFSEHVWGIYKSQRPESSNGVLVQLHEARMAKPDGYKVPLLPCSDGPLDFNVDYKTYEKGDFKFDAIICADLNMVSRSHALFESANLLGLCSEYCYCLERLPCS